MTQYNINRASHAHYFLSCKLFFYIVYGGLKVTVVVYSFHNFFNPYEVFQAILCKFIRNGFLSFWESIKWKEMRREIQNFDGRYATKYLISQELQSPCTMLKIKFSANSSSIQRCMLKYWLGNEDPLCEDPENLQIVSIHRSLCGQKLF